MGSAVGRKKFWLCLTTAIVDSVHLWGTAASAQCLRLSECFFTTNIVIIVLPSSQSTLTVHLTTVQHQCNSANCGVFACAFWRSLHMVPQLLVWSLMYVKCNHIWYAMFRDFGPSSCLRRTEQLASCESCKPLRSCCTLYSNAKSLRLVS